MKLISTFAVPAVVGAIHTVESQNPVGKVVELLNGLYAKIVQEGEVEQKAFKKFVDWCDETSRNGDFAVKRATEEKASNEAAIDRHSADISVSESRIATLGGSIASLDEEVRNATKIREHEKADFLASEKELTETIDTLDRATTLIEREMNKRPAAFAQIDAKNVHSVLSALSTVLDAASFSSTDQRTLASFVQSFESADEFDAAMGAPAAAVYTSKSNGILETLEDLKEKAATQLSDLRKVETTSAHNFDMLKQSLEDQKDANSKDMAKEKDSNAASKEAKSGAEADLQVAVKDLKTSKDMLATAHSSCMTTAADHEASTASRDEELKAINEAKKILEETTSGAVSQSYNFLQESAVQQRAHLAGSGIVAMMKQLGRKENSVELQQLASRVESTLRTASHLGEDPFQKVKGMIQNMMDKLKKEMGEEASEKAYCDEQMSKTEEKKADLSEEAAKLMAKVDKDTARAADLKQQVKELQGQLAALAKGQADMQANRKETHDNFVNAKKDLETGLRGVRLALEKLREFYGGESALLQNGASMQAIMSQPAAPVTHSKASGAGGNIIEILEVVESDFGKNLAKMETEEDDAQSEFEKITQENSITKTTKEQDVAYKTKEASRLDKSVTELTNDHDTVHSELGAVLEYYDKIRERCIAKPESYESRKARRAAEIAGLKEALTVLEEETAPAFVQRKRAGNFRGTLARD